MERNSVSAVDTDGEALSSEEYHQRNLELFEVVEEGRAAQIRLNDADPSLHRSGDMERVQEGLAARDELVEFNFPLVYSALRKIPFKKRQGVEKDLLQAGAVGLVAAIDEFDLSRGYRLSTLAEQKIKAEMFQTANTEYRAISLPYELRRDLWKLHRAYDRLKEQSDIAPSLSELAEATQFSLNKVRTLERIKGGLRMVSLDQPLNEDSSMTLRDTIAESAVEDEHEGLQELIHEALGQLSDRDRNIFFARLGVGREVAGDLRSLGEEFGLSHQTIKNIQDRALELIREKVSTEFNLPRAFEAGKHVIEARRRGRKSQLRLDIDHPNFRERLSSLEERHQSIVKEMFDLETGEQLITPSEFAKADPEGRTAGTIRTYLSQIRHMLGVTDI